MIDRCAIILRPRQPFLDWEVALGGTSSASSESDAYTVYLLPVFESYEHLTKLLRDYAQSLFEIALEASWEDPADWPEKRDYATFRKWFHVDEHSMVVDMCAYDDPPRQI